MRAAVMTAFRQPLEIRDLPDPQPGDNDAVVRVEACGVCRSDWHLWQEDWSWVGVALTLPAVPGHEVGGVVEHVGKNVTRFKPGDKVTIPFHLACGACEYCWTGRSNICQAFGFVGAHTSGGYGELTPVPNADMNLIRLPDGVAPTTAAALGCRYMTSYHGLVDRARVQPGEWVVVLGMGGVGLAAVQIASALGGRVVAVSRSQEKLDQARREGAVATVQAGDTATEAIRDATGGGAHVSIDALGITATTVPGILALRKGGRHVQLGLTGKEEKGLIAIPVDAMLFQELSFHTSSGCPHTSYPGLLSMVASGLLKPERLLEKTIDVGGVNDVLGRMTDYKTSGFNIITSWASSPATV
jgi:D-arabinose 1-dehydrogenase-like Zn-dependent alcohol dehydrogenase